MGRAERWAQEEFGGAILGDVRRTRRLVMVACEVAEHPAGTVTGACASSASREGAFRLLENSAVRSEAILQCVQRATLRRCAGRDRLFVAVDSTSLHITDTKRKKGIGAVGTHRSGARGVHVMSALAVDGQGSPLGLAAQHMWVRKGRSRRGAKDISTSGGETQHWLKTLESARRLFADGDGPRPWYQLDRGADCWQVFSYAEKVGLLLTVRATHDRRLDSDAMRLRAALESTPVRARKHIEVPARPPRRVKRRKGKERRFFFFDRGEARRVKLEIRAARLPLKLRTADGVRVVEMNAVLAKERNGKRGQAVEWLLLTTAPIRTAEEILEVVRGYTFRWRIEDFHRVWKRGLCCVEDTQLRSREAIYKWITLLASVATRAMRLTHLARQTPDAPASTELSPVELEALNALRRPKKPLEREPTLAEAVRWIAELGGYTGPWNGPPGPTTVGRGLHDLVVTARAFEFRDKK